VTLECAGNGRAQLSPRPLSQPWLLEAVGTAEWTGTPLLGLLEEAGVDASAAEVLFRGADRGVEGGEEQQFERSLPLAEALHEEVLLAYAMNGRPLPPQHGFPLRLVVPGWYGMTSVKWLEQITVLDRPFEGYQQARGYRLRQTPDEDGEPVSRMLPRSLLVPPGIPDFATRERTLGPGRCEVRGRAWSGFGPVNRVEVSVDGGASWSDARLGGQTSNWAWRAWDWAWEASVPGVYELCCRATDSTGNTQPLAALDPGRDLHRLRPQPARAPRPAALRAGRLGDFPGAAAGVTGHAADHLAERRPRHLPQLSGATAALAGGDRRTRLGAVAVAVLTGANSVVGDLAPHALDHVSQLDLGRDQDVPARRRSATAEPESLVTEDALEEVVDRAERRAARVKAPGTQTLVAVGVVGLPSLGVGEHLVSLGGGFELLLRLGVVAVHVRVQFPREGPEGLLDLALARVPGDPELLVVVAWHQSP